MSTAVLSCARQGCKVGLWLLQKRRHVSQRSHRFHPLSLSDLFDKSLHTTTPSYSIMEFFDDEKNWGEDTVNVGRAWKMEELRIKSNSDLHKLWYVLLKERNMLLTMEHECKEEYEAFPNPERLDKVKESMHNLEEVVIERNRAYLELETGETGLRPAKTVINQIGLPFFHRMKEYLIPKFANERWRKTYIFNDNYYETKIFLAFLEEKKQILDVRRKRGQTNHVLGLMRRFPNLDLEAVKEKFPDVDVDKIKHFDKARSHSLI